MKNFIYLIIVIPFFVNGQNRYYVNTLATGSGTGATWQDAFTDLQDALAVSTAGDEIWVAEGDYRPTTLSDRNISFTPMSGVKMIGGFAGNETQSSERNWKTHPTVLNGDIGISGDSLDNSYNVVYLLHPDSTTLIDGFYIKNGNADYFGASPARDRKKCGGGIYINGQDGEAYPIITNCVIEKNTARTSGGGIMINGGGMGSVAPQITRCRIADNHSLGNGGGMYRFGGSWIERGVDMEDCAIINNKSGLNGAGYYYIDTERNDDIEFLRDTFESNIAGNRGGGIFMDVGRNGHMNIDISDSYFNKNGAAIAPAIDVLTNSFLFVDSIKITSNTFLNHISNTQVFGLISFGAAAKATSIFVWSKNNISQNGGTGAIISFEYIGCQSVKFEKSIYINNNFSQIANLSKITKVIMKEESIDSNFISHSLYQVSQIDEIEIHNSKYTRNIKTIDTLNIFGNYLPEKKIRIENSIIGNPIFRSQFLTPADSLLIINSIILNDIFSKNYYASKKYTSISNSWFKTIDCSTIPPEYNVICGPGILTGIDPLFVNSDSNNYHLQPCSPLINAGTNTVIQPDDTDLDGNARIRGGTVDIGPYESAPLSLAAAPQTTGSCPGGSNGTVSFATDAACEPVLYNWSGPGGTSGSALEQLAVGDYSITLTDAKNDTLIASFSIPEGASPQVVAQTTPVICGTTTGGTAMLDGANGTAPFSFDWGNGVIDSMVTGLAYGIYPVTITDANGCTASANIQIARMGNLQVQIIKNDISCHDESDGSITIEPTNGAPPYEWLWQFNGSTAPDISDLTAGNYAGTMTDNLGCAINWIVPIENPDTIAANTEVTPANGPAIADGSILLVPSGGTGDFTAAWDNGANGMFINNLLPGFYTVTITDDNDCTQIVTVEVPWSSGTDEVKVGQVRVWPNPAQEWVTVQPPAGFEAFVFYLTDAHGRQVRKLIRSNDATFLVDLEDLPNGVYFWTINSNKVSISDFLIHNEK